MVCFFGLCGFLDSVCVVFNCIFGLDGGERVYGFREVSGGLWLSGIWLFLRNCVAYMEVEGASAVVRSVAFPAVAASWGLFIGFTAVFSGVVRAAFHTTGWVAAVL